VAIIFAATNGYLDAYPVADAGTTSASCISILDTRHADLLKQNRREEGHQGELTERLKKALGTSSQASSRRSRRPSGSGGPAEPMPALIDIRRRIRSVKSTQQNHQGP